MSAQKSYEVASSILTQGDDGTPSVIELIAWQIIDGVRTRFTGPFAARVQVCNDGTFADSTNATIAATTGYGTILETHQATKDITFHNPVDAAAIATLTISSVVIDEETVTINGRVYEFSTDGDIESGSDVMCDISAGGTKAAGTLTIAEPVTAGDTMTIGTKTYTFRADGTASLDGEIDMGADEAATKVNIVAAINGTDGNNVANGEVTAAAFSSDDCIMTAICTGIAGNTLVFVEGTLTHASNVLDGSGTLGGAVTGVDVSATEAGDALVAALAADASAVCTGVNTTGTVVLTSDTVDVASNAYTSTETMANGAFGAGTFAGGTLSQEGVIRVTVTDGTIETITVRFGESQIGGIPANYADAALQLSHAAA